MRTLIIIALLSPLPLLAQGGWSGAGTISGSGKIGAPSAGLVCQIVPPTLPNGVVGTPYPHVQMTSLNCTAPVTWSVSVGALPSGLSLSSSGLISGTPVSSGSVSFTITLVDNLGNHPIFPSTLNITSTTGAGFPLPPDTALSAFNTSMAGTPTNNITICVGTPINSHLLPGGACSGSTFAGTTAGLQSALNAVACGQIINVANIPGLGVVTLPNNRKCPNNAWIWLSFHDLSDPVFPPEGVKPDPCYIGIPQIAMPWYPYPLIDSTPNTCSRHMAQIITTASSNNACLRLNVPASGANIPSIGHWRIMGLDCTRDQSSDALTTLIDLNYQPAASGQDCALSGSGNSALPTNPAACAADQYDHIVLDRNILHGDPQRQTIRAVSIGGGTFLAPINNYIYDISDTFAGGQGDAQSFAGGFGHGYTGVGNWLFQNNFSASSTEGSLFCGAFTEPKSPVTNADGIPTSVIWNLDWYYKPVIWDTQRGQALNETIVNEGTTYPPVGDQEIVWQPTTFQIQQGTSLNLNNTWLNDSAGGWNRFNITGTPPNVTGTATIDGVDWKTITSANGILTKTNVTVNPVPWQMTNIIQWQYIACAGSNNPAGVGCTSATTPGVHTIIMGGVVIDSRAATLGNNRTLTTTITATVTTGAPANMIALTPSAPDLQIQPSYSDAFGNVRNFGYVLTAITNFTSVSMTYKVDGTVNGSTSVGQICTITLVPCTAPGSNDHSAVYVAPSVGGLGPHTITVTSAAGTVSNPVTINVSRTSPVWGYDLKANTVKNMWEAKCVNRGILENSLLENTWGSQGNGGGQNTMLLNQSINQSNQVTDGSGANVGYGPQNDSDLLVTYNHLLHGGGGLTIAALGQAKGIHRLTYSNLLLEDLNNVRWSHGFLKPLFSTFLQFSGTAGTTVLPWTSLLTPLANDIYFSHITSVGGTATTFGINNWLSIANNNAQFQLGPFAVNDSIFQSPGSSPFFNNNGEANDCGTNATGKSESVAFLGTGYTPPTPCFSNYNLSRNVLVDNSTPLTKFVTPTIWQTVDSDPALFRNFAAGDYRVVAGGPYDAGGAREASDNLALGADIAGILANDATIRWGGPNPMVITTTSLPSATHGIAYSQTLGVTGGTGPYKWTATGGVIPPGAQDILDYACAPFRATQHLTGSTVKYCVLNGNLMMWIKGSAGCPADGEAFDGYAVYQWYTEGPTFSNCSGFKRYYNPVPLWKRYHRSGDDDVILSPGPNKYQTTESCGTDHLADIDNLDIKGELTGPFTDKTFQTDCIAAGGTTLTCNVPDATPYLLAQKFIKGTAGVYQTRERYTLALGYGQIIWDTSHLSGGSYVIDQTSTNESVVSGGNPTPNFACGIPTPGVQFPLPAGVALTSTTPMTIVDTTGVLKGTPSTAGSNNFTVQVEDSVGHIAQQNMTLVVQ